MSSPPTTVIYYVPTDYSRTRDWAGSDIALITLLGVTLFVIVTCAFADCYSKQQPDTRRRRGGSERYAEYDGFEEGLRPCS
jgi:hypothetical protein